MNYYETLYIVHPALESGRLKDIILEVEENLKKSGGTTLVTEFWGKRKLAYFIDKQKYGTYVLLQFNGEGRCTSDFAVELEHNPNILAYLTTAIEKEALKQIEEDLDTQIAGKTRENEKPIKEPEPEETSTETIEGIKAEELATEKDNIAQESIEEETSTETIEEIKTEELATEKDNIAQEPTDLNKEE